jgi:hypothetical protein
VFNQHFTQTAGVPQVTEPRDLRVILRENVARLLYDSTHLGDGPQWEDLDPAIRATWMEDARAAQRLTDPIVRTMLSEMVAQAMAQERGWDWPWLSGMPVAVGQDLSPEDQDRRIQCVRIEARQRLRYLGRLAVRAVLQHLRQGGNDKHPHQDADMARIVKSHQQEDEARRNLLKRAIMRPAVGGVY